MPRQIDRIVTASATLFPSDNVVLVDTTAGAVTLTLPDAANARGLVLTVKRVTGGGNACTVQGAGSDVIDGSTLSLPNQYDVATLAAVLTTSPNTYGWVVL